MNMLRPFLLPCLAIAAVAPLHAADGVVQVKLGAIVVRTFEQVQADGMRYAPKQDFEPATNETRVYLPYGGNRKLYHEVVGQLSDPAVGSCAEFVCDGGDKASSLTYKLAFDKPIASFRCRIGYTELVQAPTSVAGVEYSLDGKAWKTVKEHPKGTKSVVDLCPDTVAVTGLNTKLLYLRMYARDSANPTAASGPEMYLKSRISGDPGWGDATSTFFNSQNQVWVTGK